MPRIGAAAWKTDSTSVQWVTSSLRTDSIRRKVYSSRTRIACGPRVKSSAPIGPGGFVRDQVTPESVLRSIHADQER